MKLLFIFFVIILICIIINELTVYPAVLMVRFMVKKGMNPQGGPGKYKEKSESVHNEESILIHAENLPDAKVSLLYNDQVQKGAPLIIYMHGGGWALGDADSIQWYAKLLASNGYYVANVEYALAPECRFPESTYQIVAVMNYLYENADQYGYDRNRIFLGGNSAGAYFSAQFGAIISNPAYAEALGIKMQIPVTAVKGILLYNGIYNFETVGTCKLPGFGMLARAFTGKKKYMEADDLVLMSPAKYMTKDFPPVFITGGDIDPLFPQTAEFAELLNDNGVECHTLFWTGQDKKLNHDYIYAMNKREESVHAYEQTVAFLKTHE